MERLIYHSIFVRGNHCVVFFKTVEQILLLSAFDMNTLQTRRI